MRATACATSTSRCRAPQRRVQRRDRRARCASDVSVASPTVCLEGGSVPWVSATLAREVRAPLVAAVTPPSGSRPRSRARSSSGQKRCCSSWARIHSRPLPREQRQPIGGGGREPTHARYELNVHDTPAHHLVDSLGSRHRPRRPDQPSPYFPQSSLTQLSSSLRPPATSTYGSRGPRSETDSILHLPPGSAHSRPSYTRAAQHGHAQRYQHIHSPTHEQTLIRTRKRLTLYILHTIPLFDFLMHCDF